MTDLEQRTAAAKFVQDWHERGNEKSDTQSFWLSLLVNVLGVKPNAATAFIQFEKSVERLGHAGYIDAYIPSTKVLIEQKSLGIDLDKAFTQAKEYAENLPFSEKPRWIVVSDFVTFRVHDMEKPHAAPEVIELKNLAKEAHRLKFLVDTGIDLVKREEEISLAAGRIIGELYDAFLKLYGENPTDDDLRNLNVLCVRIVFCLYAEDAGILPKNAFHDYLNKFVSSDIRVAMRDFFETLNTPIAERGRFLDPDLARLPYVNGGLFGEGSSLPRHSSDLLRKRPCFAGAVDMISQMTQIEGMGKPNWESDFLNRGNKDVGNSSSPRIANALSQLNKSAQSAKSAGNKNPRFDIPPFSTSMRQLLLQKASLNFDWSAISPTIFGAVFESTLNPDTRRKGGMHYTSVENIHKVIDPLFLDALWREFGEIVGEENSNWESAFATRGENKEFEDSDSPRITNALSQSNALSQLNSRSQLNKSASSARSAGDKKTREKLLAFQQKLASLTFLDPACGSGNFLTETYLSLRRLENEVLRVLLAGQSELDLGDLVRVNIHQFYGIEINDFAVTVAKTALWIAESQMLKETEDILHRSLDFLPLKTYSNIVEANALTLDWETVVPRERLSYIIGNPPFVGARFMSAAQKSDLVGVFGAKWKNVGNLDFVTAWYKKAADLMRYEVRGKGYEVGGKRIRAALVSTNSICQGESVADLWKPLMADGVEIDFAWRTFRWDSESIGKARVHCVIVGFSCREEPKSRGGEEGGEESKSRETEKISSAHRLVGSSFGFSNPPKLIFSSDGRAHRAAHINAYLIPDGIDVFVEPRNTPLCDVPSIGIGNKPIDGGNYLFTEEEKNAFLEREPAAAPYFRKWYGAQEFINNRPRWCLWLGDCSPAQLRALPQAFARVKAVRDYRLKSPSAGTRKIADKPTRFHVENMPTGNYLTIPEVSSERRRYIPIGFMTPDVLCSNKLRIMPNATLYHFGVLTSSVHMAWMRTVCCRLENRYSYSVNGVYNNFPWPELGESGEEPKSRQVEEGEESRNRGVEISSARRFLGSSVDSSIKKISATAQAILDARARYPDCSFADLYDDDAMPPDLRAAHAANDRAVLSAYGFDPTATESEIVAELMCRYQSLSAR